MDNLSAKEKFVQRIKEDPELLASTIFDVMKLATSHDPEHAEELKKLDQDARRALRWANRLFGRVGKLESLIKAQAKELKDAERIIHNFEDRLVIAERHFERSGAPQ